MKYKVVSLFSGCGGADLGLLGNFSFNGKKYKKLPFEIVYANDIDVKAINTHNLNIVSRKTVCADICETLSDDIPEHDVLVGGFPCQSFSTVNPTKDPFDDRANLYRQMARIIKDKQPKIFIAENVRGFMTLHGGSIFRRVMKEFEDCGYVIYHSLINAADFGIPQKRQRVIVVGVRKDIPNNYEFPVPTNVNNWVPLSSVIEEVALKEEKYYFSQRAVEGMKNAKSNMKRGLAQNLNEPSLTITSHLAKVSLNSRDPVLLVDAERERYRRFTPREAARIQSFPDTFQFAGSEADAYRQIGNAIPPVLFWHISKSIVDFLNSYELKINETNSEEKQSI